VSSSIGESVNAGRYEGFQRALSKRAELAVEERAFLDAIEPWFREPPVAELVDARLSAAEGTFPGVIEFPLSLCGFRVMQARFDAAIDACRRALEIESNHPRALFYTAGSLRGLGHVEAARATYQQCLDVSPGAESCLREMARIEAGEGHCNDAERDLRRLVALSPSNRNVYEMLANVLAAVGAAPEALQFAIDRQESLLSADFGHHFVDDGVADLALFEGKFAEADGILKRAQLEDERASRYARLPKIDRRLDIAIWTSL
jgi:tetratricopeptide (TPR) repeat protein